jgi:hypothetical protein
MRKLLERVGVIIFWLLMLSTFLISALRRQQTIPAPSARRADPTAQEPQLAQPDATPHREPLVDSGMIEVALVIATVGFLLYEFGDEFDVPQSLGDLTMKQIGKVIVFVGIAAAFLLHTSFWDVWIQYYNRKTGHFNGGAIPVLIGHFIIYLVLAAAMFMSASFALGNCGLLLAVLAMAILIPAISPPSPKK